MGFAYLSELFEFHDGSALLIEGQGLRRGHHPIDVRCRRGFGGRRVSSTRRAPRSPPKHPTHPFVLLFCSLVLFLLSYLLDFTQIQLEYGSNFGYSGVLLRFRQNFCPIFSVLQQFGLVMFFLRRLKKYCVGNFIIPSSELKVFELNWADCTLFLLVVTIVSIVKYTNIMYFMEVITLRRWSKTNQSFFSFLLIANEGEHQ